MKNHGFNQNFLLRSQWKETGFQISFFYKIFILILLQDVILIYVETSLSMDKTTKKIIEIFNTLIPDTVNQRSKT